MYNIENSIFVSAIVKFKVEQVVPSKKGWDVTTKQLQTGLTSTTSYQAVMVTNLAEFAQLVK